MTLNQPFWPLVRRIIEEATVIDSRILKIDHFLNHQIEPGLMQAMGQEMAQRLTPFRPDLILTAEASGIAPGLATALAMQLPLVFAKKYSPMVDPPAYSRIVPSATKGTDYRLVIATRFLPAGARIAIVDDFLANGRTAVALVEMVHEAQAQPVVAGFLVEKMFQQGRSGIEQRGTPVGALARVERLEGTRVIMAED